ncbi:Os03g0207475 [Oryza sativa Japonica Group]|uniref:Os03g0207475 protein n=1 Tax=Oryza sativa subsp. japonica TaxID=39947 RepID=A0A0N7KGT1_ORYSJ|nr:hypothetical protein EE612_016017 [Oryza sativa]BAS82881.1 Os03g0207475 [Oryza sativa Japonica Group]
MGCFPAVPSLALSRTLPSSAPAVTSPPIGSVDPQSLPPLPQLILMCPRCLPGHGPLSHAFMHYWWWWFCFVGEST